MVLSDFLSREQLDFWLSGWVAEAGQGHHWAVKNIHKIASTFKERYCTNGLWSPGAEAAYNRLLEGADEAQQAYEDACPGMG